MSSRVTVALKAIGEIPFDGLVLPVLSPDASFLATQVGGAPSWDALLAGPDARAPYRTRIEAYDLRGAMPARVDGVSLPAGWLLGRGADERGFLCEVINPDGSRDIARVPWRGGEPEWLARTGGVNAHAALFLDGSVVYCARAIDEPRFSIVIERGGAVSTYSDPDASLMFPVPTPEGGAFYCYALTRAGGLELRLVRASSSGGDGFGVAMVWPLLEGGASAFDAYQCAARAAVRGGAPYELLAVHPRMGGAAIFDPGSESVAPLHRGSIAGAWIASDDPLRVLLSARDGLMHQQAARTGAGLSVSQAVRMERDPWVPVSTSDADFPWVLIGPEGSGAGSMLILVRMSLASPSDAAPGADQSSSE